MEGRKMAMSGNSSAIWIVSGLLVAGLLVFIALKKKKII
jgi:LPXTG-motif cell wall-anchored protein